MDGIAYDIMKARGTRGLRRRIEALRQAGSVRPGELERLARSLGRTRVKRGKHSTWVRYLLPTARPVSIPNHSGDLNRFTARAILDQLEEDLSMLEELADQE
jgi:hypothetical protein